MRLILYTGKGGVGKSSVAAATAVRAAASGQRTLLVSSDLAHNLSDIFDERVGGEVAAVAERLSVLEVDALKEVRESWGPAQEYLAEFLSFLEIEDAVAEEVALFPGLDDFFVLTRILKEVESGEHEVIVVDCAPTAGTLRMLTLSDSACTRFNKLMDLERQVMKVVRPLLKASRSKMRKLVPEDEVYRLFEELIGKVGRLGKILKDEGTSSVRLVLNPDRIAIAETRRAFTYFGLFGFPVDAVVVNKVLPAALEQGYLHDWYGIQQEMLGTIEESFLEVTQLRAPLLDHEPIGVEALTMMGEGLFGEQDAAGILSASKPVMLLREEGVDQLRFRLPSIEKSELDIGRKDGDLILTAGGYTRVFALPDTLVHREIAEATFEEGQLMLSFGSERANC